MPLHIGLDSGHAGTRRIAVEQRWGSVAVVAPPARAAQVVLSASAAGLTFRALSFPFADRRRLEVMVAQELEHSLGFPPGEAGWDFVARPPGGEGDNVYVVACPRVNLDGLLASAPEPPTVVDAEPYAYQRVLAQAGVKDAIVADFGASHTTFCRVRDGHVDYIRVLLRGGADLDAVIGRRHAGGRPDEGQALKHEKGLAIAEVREFFDRLVSDALLPPEPADAAFYITGGGARTPGLESWLASKVGRPVLKMTVPEGIDPYTDVVAFGMALWGMRGGEGVNLYTVKETRSYALPITVFLVLSLLFVSADVAIRRVVLGRELLANQEAIRVVARNAAGVNSLAELESVLSGRSSGTQGAGRNMEALVMTLAAAVNEAKAKEKAGDVKIEEVVVGANEIRIKGSAAAYPAIEALKSTLAARFGNVNVSTTQLPPEPGQTSPRQSFTMVAPLAETPAGGVAPEAAPPAKASSWAPQGGTP